MGPVRLALRGTAIAIAVAGMIDPVVSLDRVAPTEVGVVSLVAALNADVARASIESLRRALGTSALVRIRPVSTAALACDAEGPCVVVADLSRHASNPPDRRGQTSFIVVPAPRDPNVAVHRATADAWQHSLASGAVQVAIEGHGVAGEQTELRVFDGDLVVGRATHQWTADGRADVRVPWWPVQDGPRVLRVEADAMAGEEALVDNVAEAGVWVTRERLSVLVFDPRPSWASAFVRRALEADPRLAVEARARVAPGIAAGTTAGGLDADAVQGAAVVVVGGLDALTTPDVELLDRYVRVRGGTLMLVPDRQPTGPATRWLPGDWRERLSVAPERVGLLRATETLRWSAPGPVDTVLAAVDGAPVVAMMPMGEGRVVMSGAMDAWRFRADDGLAFERFWQGLVVSVAPLGQELSVEVEGIVAAGDRAKVEVRRRQMTRPAAIDIGATVTCGGAATEMVRLWPSGQTGVFAGTWVPPEAGPCVVEARVATGTRAAAGAVAAAAPRVGIGEALAAMDAVVTATGGLRVAAGGEARVASHVLASHPSAREVTATRPLRSPWWMAPFALCLGGEWWLRRRTGLR